MRKIYFTIGLALALSGQAQAQRILFDNTKAESSGNADWVIDADVRNLYINSQGQVSLSGSQSNAQRIPTPAQSAIDSFTPENYWTGAISAWGIECAKLGYEVESLPWNVAITYGDATNAQDLSRYQVFVIDEPNLKISLAEQNAIVNFVKNGGGLYIISDHDNSDRNNDGWDSPAIWNDLFANNTVKANPFGFTFDLVDISGSYAVPANASDSCVNGPFGTATSVKWSGGTTMTVNTSANSTVKIDASKTNGNPVAVHGYYGKGRFAAIGDSSPTDDATGDPGDVLYNGWTTDASGNHRRLIMNTTVWLMGGRVTTGISDPRREVAASLYPNPVGDILRVKTDELSTLQIFNMSGQIILESIVESGSVKLLDVSGLSAGIYIYKWNSENNSKPGRIVKK